MLTSVRILDERYKPPTDTGSGYRPGYIRWGARVYEGEDPVEDAATYDDYVIAAADLGYTFYPEERIGIRNPALLHDLIANQHRFVVQCPALCHCIEEFSADDVAIVLMRRDVADIVASEERIKFQRKRARELTQYGRKDGVISEVRYDHWEKHQRPYIAHAFEVEYESLGAHPLWVPKEQRAGFSPRQTRPGRRK